MRRDGRGILRLYALEHSPIEGLSARLGARLASNSLVRVYTL